MAVAGFPIGQRSRLAGPVQRIVRRHSTWSRRIHSLLTTTKLARNGIVHEGYRDVEVRQQMPSADERDLLIFLRCALVSLHEHTEYVLANGAAPLARLWDDGSLSDDSMQKRAAWTVQCLEGEHDRFAK
jgi:hypothetical protein